MNNGFRKPAVPAWLSGGGAGAGIKIERRRKANNQQDAPVNKTPAWLQGFDPIGATVNMLDKYMPRKSKPDTPGGRRGRPQKVTP